MVSLTVDTDLDSELSEVQTFHSGMGESSHSWTLRLLCPLSWAPCPLTGASGHTLLSSPFGPLDPPWLRVKRACPHPPLHLELPPKVSNMVPGMGHPHESWVTGTQVGTWPLRALHAHELPSKFPSLHGCCQTSPRTAQLGISEHRNHFQNSQTLCMSVIPHIHPAIA